MMRWSLVILAACDSGAAKPKPAPPITNAPAPVPVLVPADALSPLDALAPVDAPPLARGTLQLTWVVLPPSVPDRRMKDILLAPLELEVTVDGDTRRVKLDPQLGALYSYNQIVCKTDAYPLGPGEVAKITFYEGGAGGYFIRRKQPDKLELFSWSQSDGACDGPNGEMIACPRSKQAGPTVRVPADSKIVETIVEVDKAGKRTPFVCTE